MRENIGLISDLESQQEFIWYKVEDKTSKMVNDLLNGEQLVPPPIPDSWIWNEQLYIRYHFLVETIKNNPIWWNNWKDKIILHNNWIEFLEWKFTINLNIFNTNDKNAIKLINSWINIDELQYIYNFINSMDNSIEKSYLRKFLNINTDLLYISSSKEELSDSYLYLNFVDWKIYWKNAEESGRMSFVRNIITVTH